jgi:hypothetical protein
MSQSQATFLNSQSDRAWAELAGSPTRVLSSSLSLPSTTAPSLVVSCLEMVNGVGEGYLYPFTTPIKVTSQLEPTSAKKYNFLTLSFH